MSAKAVHFLAIPGFADWEAAHALAEVRRTGGYEVRVVGIAREPIQSMGGVTVLPSFSIDQVTPSDVAIFVLPGGERWEKEPLEPQLISVLKTLDEVGVPIAAICAATTAVARVGLLHGRRHTSNGLDYLKEQVPDYKESAAYVDEPAVRDRGLITASGLGDVEFGKEILAELNVLGDDDRALWASMFRSGRFPDAAS